MNNNEDLIFHVIVRGNNRIRVFENESDKKKYKFLIKKYKEKLGFELYAYVIMDNHVHMLVKTTNENLSKITHRLNTAYSKYFNIKYNRTGHTFEKKQKKIICQEDAYLLQLIKYIHRNPEKIGKDIDRYEWSSHKNYTYDIEDIVDLDFIKGILANGESKFTEEYIKLIEEC